MYDVKSTVYSPCEANVPRCERAPGGALLLTTLMMWRAFGYPALGNGAQLGVRHEHPGRVVQVKPMKPRLKLPGAKRLKLNCDILLSTSALKINLRQYIQEAREAAMLLVEQDRAVIKGDMVSMK